MGKGMDRLVRATKDFVSFQSKVFQQKYGQKVIDLLGLPIKFVLSPFTLAYGIAGSAPAASASKLAFTATFVQKLERLQRVELPSISSIVSSCRQDICVSSSAQKLSGAESTPLCSLLRRARSVSSAGRTPASPHQVEPIEEFGCQQQSTQGIEPMSFFNLKLELKQYLDQTLPLK